MPEYNPFTELIDSAQQSINDLKRDYQSTPFTAVELASIGVIALCRIGMELSKLNGELNQLNTTIDKALRATLTTSGKILVQANL